MATYLNCTFSCRQERRGISNCLHFFKVSSSGKLVVENHLQSQKMIYNDKKRKSQLGQNARETR